MPLKVFSAPSYFSNDFAKNMSLADCEVDDPGSDQDSRPMPGDQLSPTNYLHHVELTSVYADQLY